MTDYRLDLLDFYGQHLATVDLEYDSDDEAVAQVKTSLRGAPGRLWRGDILVRRFVRQDH